VQIRNSPKYYFIDPSIAAAALNIKNPETLINDKNTFGLFFENLVIKELKTYADLIDAEIYYFRDNTGFEIDCIMEFKDET
jgi:predicted AAA+ superfamily ATPase